MADRRIYLDYNATSPVRPSAASAVMRAMSLPGNASSVHNEGRAARALVETGRDQVASLVGARARNVYFTSGGTEANNTVLSPGLHIGAAKEPAAVLVVSATEHPSVLAGHRFPAEQVRVLPVRNNGIVDLEALEALLEDAGGRAVVSIHLANNETGIIQPIRAAAEIVHRHGGVMHTDAVQAAGRLALDIADLGVDVMTVSSHKIGGPKGAGAIILGSASVDLGGALIRGGGQERGNRSGTENVISIAGFGAAAEDARAELTSGLPGIEALRRSMEKIILDSVPDAVIIGKDTDRLANTLAVAFPGQRAETLLIVFDLAGVALSSGSACSSGKVKRSHVLDAMGMDRSLAEGAVRISLGWDTDEQDTAFFALACQTVFKGLYR